MGLLADVFSAADTGKRYIKGLIADPVGTAQQAAGNMVDTLRNQRALQAQAFGNPRNPLQVTNQPAMDQMTNNYLTGLMNFGGVGTVKNVNKLFTYPQQKALDAAQRNAALPVEQGGLGLRPDNTPMERALAMGAEDAFHGTANDVLQIDVGKAGSVQKSDWGQGFYATPSPRNASYYATEASKSNNAAREDAWAKFEALDKQTKWLNGSPIYPEGHREALNAFRTASREAESVPVGANVMPLSIDTSNAAKHVYEGMTDPHLAAYEANKGHGVVKIFNNPNANSLSEMVVTNPALVRSRFAAFDPMRRNENDLLAGALPFTALIDQDNRNYLRGLLNP